MTDGLDHRRRDVLDALEDLLPEAVTFTTDLVSEPSVRGEEAHAQSLVRERLESFGFETRLLDAGQVEGIESHPEYADEGQDYHERPNVIGTIPGSGDGRSLCFNGHVDVVPAGDVDQWSFDPFAGTVEDGRILGRGASDMKGGVAAMIYALAAIDRADVDLAGDVVLQSVIEEEAGGFGGTLATVLDGPEVDAAIIPEPTDFDLWIANVGVSYVRVSIAGQGAHAAETDAGVNAIEKAYPVFRSLVDLHDDRKHQVHDPLFESWHEHTVSLNPGTLHAGEWPSSVPDEAVLEARVSHAPSESRDAVRAEVEDAIADATTGDPWFDEHPPVVEWYGWRGSSAAIDPDEAIVETIQGVMRDAFDRESRAKGFPGGIDTRFFVNYADTPAVCMGPGAYNIHGTDEYLPIDDLERTAKALALVAMEWCGVAG